MMVKLAEAKPLHFAAYRDMRRRARERVSTIWFYCATLGISLASSGAGRWEKTYRQDSFFEVTPSSDA